MTQTAFKQLPLLLMEHHVLEIAGYTRNTLDKMIDCGVLRKIRPVGAAQSRFQKCQVAKLVGLDDLLAEERRNFAREKMLLAEKAVTLYTGYSSKTLRSLCRHRSLELVRPPGVGNGRYRKAQIAQLVGLEEFV